MRFGRRTKKKRDIYFATICFTIVALLHSQREMHIRTIITFETDGGFTNQVLDIIYVSVLATTVPPAAIVLPTIIENGKQTDGHTNQPLSRGLDFTDILQLEPLASVLRPHRVYLKTKLSRKKMAPCSIICESHRPVEECQAKLRHTLHLTCHVHIQAPFINKIWEPALLEENADLVNSLLENLKPSKLLQTEILSQVEEIKRKGDKECFSFIHARIENDWKAHCQSWLKQSPNSSTTTCYLEPSEIMKAAKDFGLFDCNLYLTYDESDTEHSLTTDIISIAASEGVKIHFATGSKGAMGHSREFRAAIQYFLAIKHADKFMGNTVSTLSAMIQRQRIAKNALSFQYNVGPTPLAGVFPGFRLPWVFTARGPNKSYDAMLKVAVDSARSKTTLLPYAILHPSEKDHPRVTWLKEKGVRVIFHATDWDYKVRDILSQSSLAEKKSSHLYADVEATLATYFRLDIGRIGELKQHQHILYTDTDVYFRQDISLLGNRIHLPETIQMGYERYDHYPLNAGIILASMPFLSSTHEDLIQLLLSENSVSDGIFGPGDQGLLNRVYEKQLQLEGPLSKALNAKPYHNLFPEATIIHFHGPKVADYAAYAVQNVTCRFDDLCEEGMSAGFCQYVEELDQYETCGLLTLESRAAVKAKCNSNLRSMQAHH